MGVTVQRGGFFGVAEMLGRLDLAGRRIVEFPTTLEARVLGRSKMKVLRTIAGHLSLLTQLSRLRLRGAVKPPTHPCRVRPMSSVGIVGGGLLGMALAAKLARQGYRVTILEAASRSGGLAAPARIGDYTWDRFYHVVLQSDQHLRALLDELGLTAAALESDPHRLLHRRPPSVALQHPGVPDLSRARADRQGSPRRHDPVRLTHPGLAPLESVLASDWLKRWSGPRAWEHLWLPLLRAKLGDNAEVASAAFIWAIIARMYGARRTGMKRETFGYVEGGYACDPRALRRASRRSRGGERL